MAQNEESMTSSHAASIECSICQETFTDPRALRCLHTFCFKCLQSLCKCKRPGDQVPCPLCREDFTIPRNGLDRLPKNFFIPDIVSLQRKVADLSKVSEDPVRPPLCEVCAGKSGLTKQVLATSRCQQCVKALCKSCAKLHTRQKHPVVSLQDQNCGKHQRQPLQLYCRDCQQPSCELCWATDHETHRQADINVVAKEMRRDIGAFVLKISNVLSDVEDKIDSLHRIRQHLTDNAAAIGNVVTDASTRLKADVDVDERRLHAEIKPIKDDTYAQLQDVEQRLHSKQKKLQNFIDDSNRLVKSGYSFEVVHNFGRICAHIQLLFGSEEVQIPHTGITFTSNHVRSLLPANRRNFVGRINDGRKLLFPWFSESSLTWDELHEQNIRLQSDEARRSARDDLRKQAVRDFANISMTLIMVLFCLVMLLEFGVSELVVVEHTKEVDEAMIRVARIAAFPSTAFLIESLPEGEPISGLTSMGNKLFVTRQNADELEVYDTASYKRIYIEGTGKMLNVRRIVASRKRRCIYGLQEFDGRDYNTRNVIRVEMEPFDGSTFWSMSLSRYLNEAGQIRFFKPNDFHTPSLFVNKYEMSSIFSISETSESNILVTGETPNELYVFKWDGTPVGRFVLQQDILHPHHAVELRKGEIVVSHGADNDKIHRVLIMNTNDRTLRQYGGQKGSGPGQLDTPLCLAISGFIFVADFGNGRVVLLSPDLVYVREVVSGLKPFRIWVDADLARLYVADNRRKNGKFVGQVQVFGLT